MKKRIVSFVLSLCLLTGLLPAMSTPVKAAEYWESWTSIASFGAGSTLGASGQTRYYYVPSSRTITNSAYGGNGLNIAGTVYLYIPSGVTLNVTGGAGSASVGGGAGIYLPSGATLVVRGSGTLNAYGGNAGAGGGGYSGSNAGRDAMGSGGSGGSGGGGAGAGIGTSGGSGGSGGSGAGSWNASSPGNAQSAPGNGSTGSAGYASASMGALYVLDAAYVTGSGGGGSTSNGSGGSGGRGYYYTSDKWYRMAAGGGGGGGGGGGYPAKGIGSGGGGGGGGGGGSTGAYKVDSSGLYYVNGVGGNGGGGYYSGGGKGSNAYSADGGISNANGSSANGTANAGGTTQIRASRPAGGGYIVSGLPGIGGNGQPGFGGNGVVQKAPTASISGAAASVSTLSTFTITYNANGGEMGTVPASQTCYSGLSNFLTGQTPVRTGYTFLGWSASSGAAAASYTAAAQYPGTASVTLYAVWSPLTTAISFSSGRGSAVAGITATYDQTPQAIAIPTLPGYTFNGFFTSETGGTMVFDGQGAPVATASGCITSGKWSSLLPSLGLYAQWGGKPYTVTFIMEGMIDFDNQNPASKSAEVICGQAFTQQIVPPSMTTHNFTGYYSEPNGAGVKFFDKAGNPTSAVWEYPSENPRLYAYWSIKPLPTALQNGSFETPVLGLWSSTLAQGTQGLYWKTTAKDGMIELTRPTLNRALAKSSYNTDYAAEGNQFAELNANFEGALYQTIQTEAGQLLEWGLSHHGRNGTDTMEVWIGTPADVLNACSQYSAGGNNVNKVDKALRARLVSLPVTGVGENGVSNLTGANVIASNKDQWYKYTGEYTVPAGQTQTMFAFVSISATGNNPAVGNLLDNIYFCTEEDIPKPTVPVTVNPPVGGSVNVVVNGFAVDTAEGTHTVSINPEAGSSITFDGRPNNSEYATIGALVKVGGSETFVPAANGVVTVNETVMQGNPLEVTVLFARKGYVILDPAGGTYQDESNEVALTVSAGNNVLTPDNAAKPGYSFAGWRVIIAEPAGMSAADEVRYELDGLVPHLVAYSENTEVCRVPTETSGLVFIAQYEIPSIRKASVTLDLDGGTLNGLPDKERYALLDSGGSITGYNLPDGWDTVAYTLDAASPTFTLGTPLKEGYSFSGWDFGAVGGTFTYTVNDDYIETLKYDGEAQDSLSLTVTALWTRTPMGVTLITNGGTLTSPMTSYTPGVTVTLPVPAKTGYVFAGWYTDSALNNRLENDTIPDTATAAVTYFAGWTLCDHSGNAANNAPTCTEPKACTVCGGEMAATGHDYHYADDDNATCISYGTQTGTCSHDSSHTVEMELTSGEYAGHSWGEYVPDGNVTCVSAGTMTRECSVCHLEETVLSDLTSELGHDFDGEAVGRQSGAEDGWEELLEPDCEEHGLESRVCADCGYTETRSLEPTEHTFDDHYTQEATCTEEGFSYVRCSKTNLNEYQCEAIEDYTVLPALGHEYYEGEITKEPTCTETGIRVYQCLSCSSQYNVSLPMLGHDYPAVPAPEEWPADWRSTTHHWIECVNDVNHKDMLAVHTPNHSLTDPDYFMEEISCSVCGEHIRDAFIAVAITGSPKTVSVDVTENNADNIPEFVTSGSFTMQPGDLTATYYLKAPALQAEEAAGEGTINAQTGELRVTKAGVFEIGMTTAADGQYLSGDEVVSRLTVNKGAQTAPETGAVNASKWGVQDGALTGLTEGTVYEVRMKPDASLSGYAPWMSLAADDEGVIAQRGAGIWEIRLPGSELYDPSPAAEVTITQPDREFDVALLLQGGTLGGELSDKTTYISNGSAATVKALPAEGDISKEGHTFLGWFMDANGQGTKWIHIPGIEEGDKTFYAVWSVNSYSLDLTAPENGTLGVNGSTGDSEAEYGSTVTIELTPRIGFELDTLTVQRENGTAVTLNEETGNVRTFTMPASDVEITVTFRETAGREAVSNALESLSPLSTYINNLPELNAFVISEVNTALSETEVTVSEENIGLQKLLPAVYGMPGINGSFDYTVTIDDPILGTFERAVTGNTILKKDRIMGLQTVVVPVPVMNGSPADKLGVTLSSPLSGYADCAAIAWLGGGMAPNPNFLGETVYAASLELIAKPDVLFENSFVPVVPGGVVSNVVIDQEGASVTFDVSFPATGGKVVDTLVISAPPAHDGNSDQRPDYKYMSGDELDLSGLKLTVKFTDNSTSDRLLSEMPGAYVTINGVPAAADVLLTKGAHHDKDIRLHYAGKEVLLGTLTVYDPPVPHLSAVYDMTVQQVQNIVTGGKTDLTVIKGDSSFDYELILSGGQPPVSSATSLGADVTAPGISLGDMTPAADYTLTLLITDHAMGRLYTHTKTFRTPAVIPVPGHPVSGGITQGNVLISLVRGSHTLATVMAEVDPDSPTGFSFTFDNVPEGVYNLVADNGEWIVTYGVTVDSGGQTDKNILIDMGTGRTQSVLECLPGAPVVVAEGLPKLFDNQAIYNAQDVALVRNSGGMVELLLVASGASAVSPEDNTALRDEAGSKVVGMLMDLSMFKTSYDSAGRVLSEERLTDLCGSMITVYIDLPQALQNASGLTVYRMHDGVAGTLPMNPELDTGLEHVRLDGNTLILVVSRFSAYALAYDRPSSGGIHPSGGQLVIRDGTGGKASGTPKNPASGQTVTITVTPDGGYLSDGLIIRDSSGKDVAYQKTGDNTYTFVMPSTSATVTPIFRKAGLAPGDVSELLNTDEHFAYMLGDDKGMFNPEQNMTRAEAAQMFYNLLRDKDVLSDKTFADVSADAWYAKAVNALAGLGIISGYPDGSFGPQDQITRAEFAAIAVRFTTMVKEGRSFDDVPATHWAYDYIRSAGEFKWIDGVGGNLYQPARCILRAEAAAIVNHMLGRYPDKNAIDRLEGLQTFPDVLTGKWYYYEVMEAANSHDYQKDAQDTTKETWK